MFCANKQVTHAVLTLCKYLVLDNFMADISVITGLVMIMDV